MALKFAIPSNIYDRAFLLNYQVSGLNPATNQLTENVSEYANFEQVNIDWDVYMVYFQKQKLTKSSENCGQKWQYICSANIERKRKVSLFKTP